jgi:hypothetical protein
MPFTVPQQVKDILNYGSEGLIALGINEKHAIKPEVINQLKADYPNPIKSFFRRSGREKYKRGGEEYTQFAKQILDHLLTESPSIILTSLASSTRSTNALAFGDINGIFEGNGINALARYLGDARVPVYVDDEQLFKKMLWLEWMLTWALALVEKGLIVDFNIPVLNTGPKDQITKRYKATQEFICRYSEQHPDFNSKIAELRKTYKINDLKGSYDAAISVLSSKVEAEEAKTQAPAPVLPMATTATAALPTANVEAPAVVASATTAAAASSQAASVAMPATATANNEGGAATTAVKAETVFVDAEMPRSRSSTADSTDSKDVFEDACEHPTRKNSVPEKQTTAARWTSRPPEPPKGSMQTKAEMQKDEATMDTYKESLINSFAVLTRKYISLIQGCKISQRDRIKEGLANTLKNNLDVQWKIITNNNKTDVEKINAAGEVANLLKQAIENDNFKEGLFSKSYKTVDEKTFQEKRTNGSLSVRHVIAKYLKNDKEGFEQDIQIAHKLFNKDNKAPRP